MKGDFLSTPSQRFQTIITHIRPQRIAVLIDTNDPEWQRTCLRVIEYLSQAWGGAHSLIIPTDGKTIENCFWELLSSFDPDILYRYQRTGHDLYEAKVHNFCAFLEQETKRASENGSSQNQVDEIRQNLLRSPVEDGFSISEELTAQIRLRLAPFDFEDFYRVNYLSAGSKPNYPLTYLGDLFPALLTVPDHITDIKNDAPPEISKPPALWLLAECGIASESYQKELAVDCNVQVVPKFLVNTTEYELINIGINPGQYFNAFSPFALSRIGLKGVRSSSVRADRIPSVLVVGDTARDFCLYYGLSRLHGRAAWVPGWFSSAGGPDPSGRLATLIRIMSQRARREHSDQFAVMSLSQTTDALRSIADQIRNRVSMTTVITENANDSEYICKLVAHPVVWYVSGAVEQISNQMVLDDQLPGTFESPAPSIFSQINPQKHRWLVELTYLGRMTPRHPALGRRLISGANIGDTRAGIQGAAYQCPGVFVMGEDMEFQVLRPSVTFPDAETVFRAAISFAGLECKVSDKGAYAQASIEKFGGLEQIGTNLRSAPQFALLRKYCDKSRPSRNVFDEGVVLRDQRRYLNFACIQKILGSSDLAKGTIDEYVRRGIFYRGFVFKCSRCADCSWFSVEELTQTFTCRRCSTQQQYVTSSWYYPNEPSWFYKLDEIVYHMLANDGDVSILTLDKLRRESMRDFQFAPELQIRTAGTDAWEMEIDICCISAGRMQIGEAKSVESLASGNRSAIAVATRYRQLAEQLSVSAVVFATTAEGWSPASESAIKSEFEKNPYLRVLRLTKDDLIS
ncbi:MAG: hypothetical protein V4555_12300 [Acidobacteriota bacterium]